MTHGALLGSQQPGMDAWTVICSFPCCRSSRGVSSHYLTRSLWASRSFCSKSRRASRTETTSTSGLWTPGVGEGHRTGEQDRAGGLALCRRE